MSRTRYTLAQLMATVCYAAFAFAALRNADEIWASATYTLAFLMVSVAPLGALTRQGRGRIAWAGFAVFGWSRFLVGALPLTTTGVFGRILSPGLLSEQGGSEDAGCGVPPRDRRRGTVQAAGPRRGAAGYF
jgi:hypothetical protein